MAWKCEDCINYKIEIHRGDPAWEGYLKQFCAMGHWDDKEPKNKNKKQWNNKNGAWHDCKDYDSKNDNNKESNKTSIGIQEGFTEERKSEKQFHGNCL